MTLQEAITEVLFGRAQRVEIAEIIAGRHVQVTIYSMSPGLCRVDIKSKEREQEGR